MVLNTNCNVIILIFQEEKNGKKREEEKVPCGRANLNLDQVESKTGSMLFHAYRPEESIPGVSDSKCQHFLFSN